MENLRQVSDLRKYIKSSCSTSWFIIRSDCKSGPYFETDCLLAINKTFHFCFFFLFHKKLWLLISPQIWKVPKALILLTSHSKGYSGTLPYSCQGLSNGFTFMEVFLDFFLKHCYHCKEEPGIMEKVACNGFISKRFIGVLFPFWRGYTWFISRGESRFSKQQKSSFSWWWCLIYLHKNLWLSTPCFRRLLQ